MAQFFLLSAALTFSAIHAASTPHNIKSLLPAVTLRQATRARAFSSFSDFNQRRPRQLRIRRECQSVRFNQFRTLSGFCNNLRSPDRGSADSTFLLLATPLRSRSDIRGLPGARFISNVVCEEATPKLNDRGMSELVTFFGQLLDHTVTLINTEGGIPFRIPIPSDDPVFTESQFIPFFGTLSRMGSPVNELSSYLDASSVYGIGEDEAKFLREMKGGRLNLPVNLLPRDDSGQFLAGDKRANENPNLTALHLLFAREHNVVAGEIAIAFPTYDDEQIYQLARHIVAAEMQAVTYYEFIPALTGRELSPYTGYKRNVEAVISNQFSTVAFRVGHTMLNSSVNSINPTGQVKKRLLRDSFFQPDAFVEDTIEGLLRGMMSGHAAEVDNGITGEVRNFLLDSETSTEQLDLPALNIQRGRDHRVPACNKLRESLGLQPFTSFDQVTRNPTVANRLRVAYSGNIEDMDAWICGIIEDHEQGSSLGPLLDRIVRQEFQRLRDGDRFYFERASYFRPDQIQKIDTIRKLSGATNQLGSIMRMIIERNTEIPADKISPRPFFV